MPHAPMRNAIIMIPERAFNKVAVQETRWARGKEKRYKEQSLSSSSSSAHAHTYKYKIALICACTFTHSFNGISCSHLHSVSFCLSLSLSLWTHLAFQCGHGWVKERKSCIAQATKPCDVVCFCFHLHVFEVKEAMVWDVNIQISRKYIQIHKSKSSNRYLLVWGEDATHIATCAEERCGHKQCKQRGNSKTDTDCKVCYYLPTRWTLISKQ